MLNEKGGRVRGLWIRGGRFYPQLDATDGKLYRYHLEHAETVPQAVLARQALKLKQAAGQLSPPSEMVRLEAKAWESDEAGKVGPRNESKTPEEQILKHAIAKYQADRDGLKEKSKATAKRKGSGLRFRVQKFGNWDRLNIKNPRIAVSRRRAFSLLDRLETEHSGRK